MTSPSTAAELLRRAYELTFIPAYLKRLPCFIATGPCKSCGAFTRARMPTRREWAQAHIDKHGLTCNKCFNQRRERQEEAER